MARYSPPQGIVEEISYRREVDQDGGMARAVAAGAAVTILRRDPGDALHVWATPGCWGGCSD